MDYNFDHQMSLSKSKCLYSNNCLCFLKRAVPFSTTVYSSTKLERLCVVSFFVLGLEQTNSHLIKVLVASIFSAEHGQKNIIYGPDEKRY